MTHPMPIPSSASRRRFRAGETLIQTADTTSDAYIIERGEVAVWREDGAGGRTLLARLREGQMVGELALVDGEGRSATVTALSECTVRVVTAEDLTNHLDGVHPVVHTLIDALLERVRASERTVSGRALATPSTARPTAFVDAVGNAQLHLSYQPIVDLPAGTPAGYVAVPAWVSPSPGQGDAAGALRAEPPGNVLADVTGWCLMRACADVNALHRHAGGCFVSVELTEHQLAGDGLVDDVFAAVSNAGIAPGQLVLGIREAHLPAPDSPVAERLRRCHAGGVRIALQDFGAALAPLARVADLPIDVIAVHRNLLRETEATEAVLIALQSLTVRRGIRLCAAEVDGEQAVRQALAHRISRIHRAAPASAPGTLRSVRSDYAVSPDDGLVRDGQPVAADPVVPPTRRPA